MQDGAVGDALRSNLFVWVASPFTAEANGVGLNLFAVQVPPRFERNTNYARSMSTTKLDGRQNSSIRLNALDRGQEKTLRQLKFVGLLIELTINTP